MRYALLAVSDELRCAGIEVLIESAHVAQTCTRISNVPSFGGHLRKLDDCALLVMDLDFHGAAGLDLLARARMHAPQLGILALDLNGVQDRTVRALRGGASGIVSAKASRSEITDALRTVASGGRFVPETALDVLVSHVVGEGGPGDHDALSNREYQTLCMLGQGMTITEIAKQFVISAKTVSTYRSRVLEKLGLQTTADLIRYAIHHDLCSPHEGGVGRHANANGHFDRSPATALEGCVDTALAAEAM